MSAGSASTDVSQSNATKDAYKDAALRIASKQKTRL
jgi:hypothetical protein